MRKLALVAGLTLAVAPAAQAQSPAPTQTDFKNAAKYCKALKTASGTAANFAAAVTAATKSTKVTESNAYGKCVSFYAKDEARENKQAKNEAVTACKADRETALSAATTNAQRQAARKAYGKCVSTKARAAKADADQKDADRVNAAKACKTARTADAAAFAAKYGTSRNAFGKCVSAKAKEANAQREAQRDAAETPATTAPAAS